jgi:integrase
MQKCGLNMARLIHKLTALEVTKVTKPGLYGDGGGLWLQVSPSGSKSWVFRFTIKSKQLVMGLGAVHTVGLSEARARAKEQRLLLLDGKNPLEARNVARTLDALERARMVTFDQCAASYIAAKRNGWRNAKHAGQWEATLSTYASPVIGALPVAAVDTGLVMKVLGPIWNDKTETAKRLRGRIESILGWATTSGYRQGDNPARWRGHLENLLAAPNKIAPVKHHASLPWKDAGAFMRELRQREGIAARALEFTILTASRSGSVRLATWAEIDGGVWTVPAEHMKAHKEHHVPLSGAALSLLASLPRTGDLIFPGTGYGKPLSDMSLTAVLKRMNVDATVHGFRSTFRMWCAESIGNNFPRDVCEHALAHHLPDKVEAAYQRGTVFEKRIQLMQTWADYLHQPQAVATVTALPVQGRSANIF